MARDPIRVAAEHECAHGVVAASLGVQVARLVIYPNGSGECIRAFTTPELSAVISAAGDLWDAEFSDQPYRDGACADLRRQVELVGPQGIWAARRRARQILAEHRNAVITLGGRLHKEWEIVFR
jgi:hypothetical protein